MDSQTVVLESNNLLSSAVLNLVPTCTTNNLAVPNSTCYRVPTSNSAKFSCA